MKFAQSWLLKFVLLALAIPWDASPAELRQTSSHRSAGSVLTCAQVLEPTINVADLPALSELTGFSVPFLREVVKNRSVLKVLRDGYNRDVKGISAMVKTAMQEGRALVEIAKAAHHMRRSIGERYKDATPTALRTEIYSRNLGRYSDELGPSFQALMSYNQERGVAPEETYRRIIQSSQVPNTKLNELIDILSRESF